MKKLIVLLDSCFYEFTDTQKMLLNCIADEENFTWNNRYGIGPYLPDLDVICTKLKNTSYVEISKAVIRLRHWNRLSPLQKEVFKILNEDDSPLFILNNLQKIGYSLMTEDLEMSILSASFSTQCDIDYLKNIAAEFV